MQNKGCRSFYLTLRATELVKSSTAECEDKWHQTLNTTFSIFFWNKTWEALKKSVVNNKIKWFMLQTNRFILPTNYTVNKYNPSQDPQCSFCAQHPEKLEMLLWGCQIVREFWTVVENILKDLFQDFILTQKEHWDVCMGFQSRVSSSLRPRLIQVMHLV